VRHGPAAVAEYLRDSRAGWRELHSERHASVRGGNVVVVHRVHGTLADGTEHSGTVADVYTVRDGRVVRMRAYADPDEPFRDGG
jgi:ketosteroid isomerase-like protein